MRCVHGKRYNRETLEVKYKEKNIYDVLEMTGRGGRRLLLGDTENIFEAQNPLRCRTRIRQDRAVLDDALGRRSTARQACFGSLSKRSTGRTIYILDEPTTGLHTDDVRKLIEVLQKLVDAGNTVLVIEHNLDIIKTADYLIDLGPEGGERGGEIVCCGTPEEVAKCDRSYTGKFLKDKLVM